MSASLRILEQAGLHGIGVEWVTDLDDKLSTWSEEPGACPAGKAPSSVDPSMRMNEHVQHRFIDVLGLRTIVHTTGVLLGSLEVV